MSESTERHARETNAKIGKQLNISREMIRKSVIVAAVYPERTKDIIQGNARMHPLYKQAIGDHRVGLFVNVQPATRELLRTAAEREGATMSQLVEWMITQIFGEEAPK